MQNIDLELLATLIDRPQSYEDLSGRENFKAPLDHSLHVLKQVLVKYRFEKEAPCGLKGCRQGHKVGCLVLTESGLETNLGQDCGRSHFGAEFDTALEDHRRLRDYADLLRKAKDLQAETPAIIERIKDFAITRAFGAKWVLRVKAELIDVIGRPLVESLGHQQDRGDFTVYDYVQRSDKEVDDMVALNPSMTRAQARDATVPIGSMEPMPWITFDFKRRLMEELIAGLQVFATLDPQQLPPTKLKAKLKPFDDHARVLGEAEDAAAAAMRFLAEGNLRLVAHWIPANHKSKAEALRNWIGRGRHAALLKGMT